MNIFEKTILIQLFLILITNKKCKLELLNSYNLEGFESPVKIKIPFCPLIEDSCCRLEDQNIIYQRYIISKEKESIENNLTNQLSAIFKNLDLLRTIELLSIDTLNYIKSKNVKSNCLLLSERITKFNILNLKNKLIPYLEKFKAFYFNILGSIYCAICDYKNQKYFKLNKGYYNTSIKTCSSLIRNSIMYLNYQYKLFPKYYNLVSYFILSCNAYGKFTRKSIPTKHLFYSSKKNVINITNCLKYRSSSDWFTYCKNICDKFSITYLSNFWLGDLKKINFYNEFLQNSINNFKKDMYKNKININKPNNVRILEKKYMDKAQLESIDEEQFEKKQMLDPIPTEKENKLLDYNNNFINSIFGSKYSLHDFTPYFSYKGLDFELIGKSSQINIETFSYVTKYNIEFVKNYTLLYDKYKGDIGNNGYLKKGNNFLNYISGSGAQSENYLSIFCYNSIIILILINF